MEYDDAHGKVIHDPKVGWHRPTVLRNTESPPTSLDHDDDNDKVASIVQDVGSHDCKCTHKYIHAI